MPAATKLRKDFPAWRMPRNTWPSADVKEFRRIKRRRCTRELGGLNNADTQQNITQYFSTVPAADLDIALRIDAACMQNIEDADAEWAQERGAIEQEVARDLSNPTYKFITRLNEDMFAGTPYAHDALGHQRIVRCHNRRDAEEVRTRLVCTEQCHCSWLSEMSIPKRRWPKSRNIYGSIPSRPLPRRPQVEFEARQIRNVSRSTAILPYVLAFIAYRLPGTSQRRLRRRPCPVRCARQPTRQIFMRSCRKEKRSRRNSDWPKRIRWPASAMPLTALPANGDGAASVAEMKNILADYANHGVPAELVDAAKRAEVAERGIRAQFDSGSRLRMVTSSGRRWPQFSRR